MVIALDAKDSESGGKHTIPRGLLINFVKKLVNQFPSKEFTSAEIIRLFERANDITLKPTTLRNTLTRLYKRGVISKRKYVGSPYVHIRKKIKREKIENPSELWQCPQGHVDSDLDYWGESYYLCKQCKCVYIINRYKKYSAKKRDLKELFLIIADNYPEFIDALEDQDE